MCGIAGVKFRKFDVNFKEPKEVILELLEHISLRGQDGFGVYSTRNNQLFKSVTMPTGDEDFFQLDFTDDLVLMNTRAQPMTEKRSADATTIQPVKKNGFVLVHNGVVANDAEICERWGIPTPNLDSELIIDMMIIAQRELVRHGTYELVNPKYVVPFTLSQSLCELSGGFAFGLGSVGNCDELTLVKDFKTLWYGKCKSTGTFFFASEKEFLVETFGEPGIYSDIELFNCEPYTINYFNFKEYEHKSMKLETKVISSLPEKDENLVLVCASGGIDSTTSAYLAHSQGKKVVMAFFDLGQKSREREWEAVQALAKDINATTKYIDIRWLGELGCSVLTDAELDIPKSEKQNIKSTVCWTPARNLVMISILVSLAESIGASEIYNGWTLEEEGSYPDNSIEFFRSLNETLQYGTLTRPEVKIALGRLMKTEVIQLGQHLGVDYAKTWSCDDGQESHCGKCGACFLHHFAFIQAGIEDPSSYVDFSPSYLPDWAKDNNPEKTSKKPIEDILRRVNK